MSDLEREWEESEEKRLTDENAALRAELDRLRAGLDWCRGVMEAASPMRATAPHLRTSFDEALDNAAAILAEAHQTGGK
jgi:hypothetical protein